MSGVKSLIGIINKACKVGVKAVLLREKDMSASELLHTAREIKKITSEYNSRLFINDRLDIALLSKADGFHSPGKGILSSQSKKFNSQLITGKSIHSVKDAKIAEGAGYDYIMFGPVFRTPAKIKYGSPQGLEKLVGICESVNIPVFAVGGITPQRIKKCLDSGAHGVAVIRSIMKSDDVNKTVYDFVRVLGGL